MNRKIEITFLICTLGIFLACNGPSERKLYDSQVLFDTSFWEVEQQPGGQVLFSDKGIEVLDSGGCTLWFKPELQGPLKIQYDINVIDANGPYDRVSDMNVFWMASDPKNKENLFFKGHNRTGQFKQYHEMELYYVGCGGHNNTRTRFRRYNGIFERPLLAEHDLTSPDVLLTPNHTYTVQLIADNGLVKYIRDGITIFEYKDDTPLNKGWFGFRIYKSHQIISNFHVSGIVK